MKKIYVLCALSLAACGGANNNEWRPTPTVDYVENLNVRANQHNDPFLTMLAVNYRSFAIWNAREAGNFELGEMFANKAVTAFSGDTPMPEAARNWPISDNNTIAEMNFGFDALIGALKNDASDMCPEIAAEAQAKFDCWVAAASTGQSATAAECRDRFGDAMTVLQNPAGCESKVALSAGDKTAAGPAPVKPARVAPKFYPDTGNLSSVASSTRTREGIIILNNVNIPENMINPPPVVQ
ncbi:MAG: hypothetical protein FWG39_03735, partial [Alphaproteobacteria bacterium]|nr:hypothetical protein [Alphaproteobacteria bacterium]